LKSDREWEVSGDRPNDMINFEALSGKVKDGITIGPLEAKSARSG